MLVPSSRPSPYLVFFVLGEMALIVAATVLALYLRLDNPAEIFSDKYSWERILVVPLVLEITFYYFDLHNFRVARPFIWTVTRLAQAMIVGIMGLTVVYYSVPDLFLGRGVILLTLGTVTSFVLVWRMVYGWALRQSLFSSRVLLMGAGSVADAILDELISRSDNIYNVVCLLDMHGKLNQNGPDSEDEKINLMPIWARLLRADYRDEPSELMGLVRYYQADMIVVAMDEKRGRMPLDDLLHCRMRGVPIMSGDNFFESIAGRILASHVNPSWLVFSPSGFTTGPLRAFSKRSFDIFLSALGLLLSSPVILLALLAIKMDSKGPVLYRQERVGFMGKNFTIFKLRSMVADAEQESGPVWSQENDPRITRAGRFLRKTRIDELPQLWNVFRGDMSFVGPRPERPHFVKRLQERLPYYSERHNVKPGVTGWAQVCYPYGASETAALEKLNYDLYYIKQSSLSTDVLIMVQTVKIFFFGGGGR